MNTSQKEQIRVKMQEFISRYPSQKKAAAKLPISEASVININKGDLSMNDELWRKLGEAVGYTLAGWQIVETKPFVELRTLFDDAADMQNIHVVTANAGTGKSTAGMHYAQHNPDALYIECDSDMTIKEFYVELLDKLGIKMSGSTYKIKKAAQKQLCLREFPLVIIDEPEKLPPRFFYSLIGFINLIRDKVGIVMMGTDFLASQLERHYKLGKKGSTELWSRIGRKTITTSTISQEDVKAICYGNGITEVDEITTILNDCQADGRRIKKLVYKNRSKIKRSQAA